MVVIKVWAGLQLATFPYSFRLVAWASLQLATSPCSFRLVAEAASGHLLRSLAPRGPVQGVHPLSNQLPARHSLQVHPLSDQPPARQSLQRSLRSGLHLQALKRWGNLKKTSQKSCSTESLSETMLRKPSKLRKISSSALSNELRRWQQKLLLEQLMMLMLRRLLPSLHPKPSHLARSLLSSL